MLHNQGMGPIGRVARLVVGAGLLYLAGFAATAWRLRWYDALLGLVLLPSAMLISGLVARHRSNTPLQLTGTGATTANCALIVALVSNPYTAPGAELFYGTTLLVAAARAQLGCEATVISNSLLHRNDQLGCPIFTPLDRAEAVRNTTKAGRRTSGGTTHPQLDRSPRTIG